MARRKLSISEQLVGVTKALKSPRTPPQLKPGLKNRKHELEKALGKRSGKKNAQGAVGFFEILKRF